MHLEPFHCSAFGSVKIGLLQTIWEFVGTYTVQTGRSQWYNRKDTCLFPKIWILIFFYKSYLKWRKKNWSFTQWSPLKWNPNDHRGHCERWKLASVWQTNRKEGLHQLCCDYVHFWKQKTMRLILWLIPQALSQKIPIGSVSFAQVPEGVLNTQISHLWVSLWNGNRIRKTFDRKRLPS